MSNADLIAVLAAHPYAARRTEYSMGNAIGTPRITRHADVFDANAQRHSWVIDELLSGSTATYSNIHDEFRIDTVRGTVIYLSVYKPPPGAES